MTRGVNGPSPQSQKRPEGGSTLEPPTHKATACQGNQDFLRTFLVHFSRISQKGNGPPGLRRSRSFYSRS